jgi:small-conductance mechanosensitive channel
VGLDRLRGRVISAAPLIYIVEQLGAYAIIMVGFVAGLSALGVNLASLTVFAGAIGVGAGLGLFDLASPVGQQPGQRGDDRIHEIRVTRR